MDIQERKRQWWTVPVIIAAWVGLAGFNTVRAPSIRRLGGRSGWVRPLERRSCSSLARLAS